MRRIAVTVTTSTRPSSTSLTVERNCYGRSIDHLNDNRWFIDESSIANAAAY